MLRGVAFYLNPLGEVVRRVRSTVRRTRGKGPKGREDISGQKSRSLRPLVRSLRGVFRQGPVGVGLSGVPIAARLRALDCVVSSTRS